MAYATKISKSIFLLISLLHFFKQNSNSLQKFLEIGQTLWIFYQCRPFAILDILARSAKVAERAICFTDRNLARSAKVAERAICFTDRNFYLFFSFF